MDHFAHEILLGSGGVVILEEPAIALGNPVFEADPRVPAHCAKAADIHQFAHRAIGFAGIGGDLALKTRDFCNHLSEVED